MALISMGCSLANAFSYWQGQKMANSSHSFFDDIMQALDRVQSIKGSKDFQFWVGETNWPSGGANFGDAVANTENAGVYWKQSVCAMIKWGVNVFGKSPPPEQAPREYIS